MGWIHVAQTGSPCGLFLTKHRYEPSGSMKGGEFLVHEATCSS
jgi:hypothetical protein